MYCRKCGAPNPDDARFCGGCGNPLDLPAGAQPGAPASPTGSPPDDGKVGALGILLFCLPLVGAILYFVWKEEQPAKAKKACTLALAGLAVGVVLQVAVNLLQFLVGKGG